MGNKGIEKIGFNDQWRMGNGVSKSLDLPIDLVDSLVDSLVTEYNNPDYKKWYYKVVYEYGPYQVEEWHKRASDGRNPARLFTKYVNDCRKYKRRSVHDTE